MTKKWVKEVQKTSAALELPEGLFTKSAKEIAAGLKKAVTERKKDNDRFASAMSMLDFYINRAGKNLKPEDKARFEQAKIELRKLFDKESE